MAGTYLGIVNDLSDRIDGGELRPGDRVPSTRQIAAKWGVAIATATKALAELQRRGLVRPVAGVGTVVAEPKAEPKAESGRRPSATAIEPGTKAAVRPRSPRTSTTPTTPSVPRPTIPLRNGDDMRDRIVHTAIQLADAEGIGAVSMRRIGIELGVPTMSLYRWMPSKDDLTLHMLDATLGRMQWPDRPPRGWRPQLEYASRGLWAIAHAHPWLAQLLSITRPQLAPNAMLHTEWSMRALSGLGLSGGETLRISLTLVGFGIGTAVAMDNERQAQRDTGITSDEWMATQEAKARAIFATGRYPVLASFADDEDFDSELDKLFEAGLAIILDGIERLIEKKAAAQGSAEPSRPPGTPVGSKPAASAGAKAAARRIAG
jgi:DNA-binding transcriptional regulator YhcF (GntR family)/AcrR family transcriptional regulator